LDFVLGVIGCIPIVNEISTEHRFRYWFFWIS